jgi:hypothetical protein
MTIELLRQAHDRAYAPQAVVTLPAPFDGPFLVFDLPLEPVVLQGPSERAEIGVRNVGDDDCFVREISTAAGLTVAEGSEIARLSYRKREWVRLPLRLEAFPLSGAGTLVIRFEVQSFRRGEVLSFEAGLPYRQQRNDTTATVIVANSGLSFVDVVEGLRAFSVDSPGAKDVVLAIEEGPEGRHRYPMRRSGSGHEISVPMAEGRHAYRFLVDGSPRLDDRILDHTLVPDVGDCSVVDVRKPGAQVLQLRNPLNAQVSVEAESPQTWIKVTNRQVRIAEGEQAELTVTVDAKGEPAGVHYGEVRLRCRSSRRSDGVVTVPVQLTLSAPGPVPAVVEESTNFGEIHVGSAIDRNLKIRNMGSGVLKGRVVTADGTSTGSAFEIAAGGAAANVPVHLAGPSEFPAAAKDLPIQLYVESNTLVTGRARLAVTARCRLAMMEFTPPALAFGAMTVGTTAKHAVMARHGKHVPKEMALTGTLPDWLRVEFDKLGTVSVVIDASRWAGGDQKVETTVTIKDTATGLTGRMAVSGEFIAPHLVVQPAALDFGTVKRGSSKRLPIKLRNEGRGELLVSQLVMDHAWLGIEHDPKSRPLETELQVRVSAIAMPPGRHRGLLELFSNDRTRPKLTIPVAVTIA